MQINPKAGLTFANGLRSMMRADPDVIMVGEIRDKETAQIAVEAALTGHLVLSTLHTNDAPGAIARLIEMGVEPFLVSSAVERRPRPAPRAAAVRHCKQEVVLPATSCARRLRRSTARVTAYEPVGCARCGGTGYKGRIGLYEVMPVNEEIRHSPCRARRPTRSPRPRAGRACARCAPRASRRSSPA